MDYDVMNVTELVAERDSLNALIKVRREEARANAKAEAEAREESARANVNEGDVVAFLFNKERVEGGKVVRTSEKTLTIESDVFKKGKGYRKYSEILEVTG
jgi:hypothetical protein